MVVLALAEGDAANHGEGAAPGLRRGGRLDPDGTVHDARAKAVRVSPTEGQVALLDGEWIEDGARSGAIAHGGRGVNDACRGGSEPGERGTGR